MSKYLKIEAYSNIGIDKNLFCVKMSNEQWRS